MTLNMMSVTFGDKRYSIVLIGRWYYLYLYPHMNVGAIFDNSGKPE